MPPMNKYTRSSHTGRHCSFDNHVALYRDVIRYPCLP